MRKLVPISLICLAALMLDPRSASAQEIGNIDVGYQFQRLSFEPQDTNFPAGFNIAAEFPVTHPLGLVGQFDWSHEGRTDLGVEREANLATFAAGIRWSPPTNRGATPYVHALYGLMHSRGETEVGNLQLDAGSDTDQMLQFGAGVAFPLGGVWNGIGQLDYRRILQGEDESGGVNVIRFVVGVRWTPG